MILDWHKWCRFCGNFEENDGIKAEIRETAEQILDIPSYCSICQECETFMKGFQNFILRARMMAGMFEEIQKTDEKTDDFLLQIRQNYNLTLPEIEIIETTFDEASDDYTEIVDFRLEDENEIEQFAVSESRHEYQKSEYDHENEILESDQHDENYSILEITDEEIVPKQEIYDDELSLQAEYLIKNTLDSHKCSTCSKKYKSLHHYENHRKRCSQSKEEYACDKCSKVFREHRHMAVHQKSHLPDDVKYAHACQHCNKRFSSVYSLRLHVKCVHINNPIFSCPHCPKTFSRKANLVSHISVHSDARNFECNECGLRVKTKGNLRVHKKTHSNDFIECPVCSKGFKTSNQMTNHMVCHTDEKRYKCSECPNAYKRTKELRTHINSVHKMMVYVCPFCPRIFSNNSNLRKHKLTMHLPDLMLTEGGAEQYDECILEETE